MLFLTLAWAVPCWAFTALSEEGIEMTFQVLDEDEKTCMTAIGIDYNKPGCIPLMTRGKVTIPQVVNGYTVVGIGTRSFITCTMLTEVVIPETVLWIDEDAFLECYSLSKMNDISQVMEINDRAFQETSLREVTLGSDDPYCDVIIGGGAFSSCTALKKLTLGENVTTIGEYAFSYCSALEAVHIPANVERIGSNAFSGLTACESITVDAANRKYEDKGCNALFEKGKGTVLTGCINTNLVHPEVTGIGKDAFKDIPITHLFIPANIQTIAANPFVLCPLESIIVDEASPYFDSREDCNAIIRKEGNMLQTGCKNTVIPSSVETIGYQSFQQMSGMTEALIPEGVKVIQNYAFYVCPDLTTIVVPSTVTVIADKGFSYNPSLEDVYSYIMEPFPISQFCFAKDDWHAYHYFDDVVLHVPKGTKEKYQNTPCWDIFLNIVEMDDNSEVVGIDAAKQVQAVRYHNLAGMTSDHPFPGINLVVTTYSDGTSLTTKVVN